MGQKPKPGHLFFTPRTPWGTRLNHQSFKRHLRASEDVPTPPKQGLGGMVNKIKKVTQWGGEHLFGGAGVEKHFGAGDPAGKGIVVGVHLGGGEKPEDYDPQADARNWANMMLHSNEQRTTQERLKNEQENGRQPPPHPGQKVFPGASPEYLNKMDDAFRKSLERAGIDSTGKSIFKPQ